MMMAVGCLAVVEAEALCRVADIVGAMSLDALEGTAAPFDERIQMRGLIRGRRRQRTTSVAFLRRARSWMRIVNAGRCKTLIPFGVCRRCTVRVAILWLGPPDIGTRVYGGH